METKIINIKSGQKYDIYCGRANKYYNQLEDSLFCNPFIIGKDGTREEVIQKFAEYAPKNKALMENLYLIDNKILACYCDYPDKEDCHCRVLLELRQQQKNIIKNKFYTGVGSRETPQDIIQVIKLIANKLANKGYILRSGGADGADNAFEIGCDSVNGQKEIYLPWKNFNNNQSNLYNIDNNALNLASKIHPAFLKLSQGAKKLHARNCYQVLGGKLDSPSKVLICWTKNGEEIGGTRTAIILAKQNNVPVYNLGILEQLNLIKQKLNI